MDSQLNVSFVTNVLYYIVMEQGFVLVWMLSLN